MKTQAFLLDEVFDMFSHEHLYSTCPYTVIRCPIKIIYMVDVGHTPDTTLK
jgi:hypothetical protein